MAPRRAEEVPVKRIAAPGCRLPARLPAGEVLLDITNKQWKLGVPIGYGGFGDIYLASDEISKSVGQDARYVVKIEPHNNGPLFVEMNFYIRAARKDTITHWRKSQRVKHIGVPNYEGSGSHIFHGERYRFVVIPRYGIDVNHLFLSHGRKLSITLVNRLAVQMLNALEYIHSRGYAHADIKGSNILLDLSSSVFQPEKSQAYLVDYGLAYRFRTPKGAHKPFIHDERRAHEGTLEFTSRDAHHGIHSRRSDLETLGYNILQWLCGRLPWENEHGGLDPDVDPEEIHERKEEFFSNIDRCVRECFARRKKSSLKESAPIEDYMKAIASLDFEEKPDYSYLKSLFGAKEDRKSKFHFDSENQIGSLEHSKGPCLRERIPCKPVNGEIRITRNTKLPKEREEFSWERILAGHPEKMAKTFLNHPSPLTPPPSPTPPSFPTYAMLRVIQRMKDKHPEKPIRHKTNGKTSDNEWKGKSMTPAMEEVAQLRKKAMQVSQVVAIPASDSPSPRLTRSRSAKLLQMQPEMKRNKRLHSPGADSNRRKRGRFTDESNY